MFCDAAHTSVAISVWFASDDCQISRCPRWARILERSQRELIDQTCAPQIPTPSVAFAAPPHTRDRSRRGAGCRTTAAPSPSVRRARCPSTRTDTRRVRRDTPRGESRCNRSSLSQCADIWRSAETFIGFLWRVARSRVGARLELDSAFLQQLGVACGSHGLVGPRCRGGTALEPCGEAALRGAV